MTVIGCFERRVPAGIDAVWARLAGVDAWAAWMPDVRWAVLEGTLADGAYVTIRPARGRQTAYRLAVDPQRRLALALSFGPVARVERAFELAPAAGGCVVVYRISVDGPLAAWLATPIARRAAAAAPGLLDALDASVA